MKKTNAFISPNGILTSHEEFLSRMGDLMNEFGFNSFYSESGKIVFDNSNDGTQPATEGLAFDSVHEGAFTGIESFFSHRSAAPVSFAPSGRKVQTEETAPAEKKVKETAPAEQPAVPVENAPEAPETVQSAETAPAEAVENPAPEGEAEPFTEVVPAKENKSKGWGKK